MNKTKVTYFVKPDTNNGHGFYAVSMQRTGKDEEIATIVNDLTKAIGYATIRAISSKHDYGNKNVSVIICENICSIDDPAFTV